MRRDDGTGAELGSNRRGATRQDSWFRHGMVRQSWGYDIIVVRARVYQSYRRSFSALRVGGAWSLGMGMGIIIMVGLIYG